MLLQRVGKERLPTARGPDRGHASGAAAPEPSWDGLSPSLSWSRRVERVWRSTSCARSRVRLRRWIVISAAPTRYVSAPPCGERRSFITSRLSPSIMRLLAASICDSPPRF